MAEGSKGPSHGCMCWLEVPVQDVSRAAKFYADVLSWDSKAAASDDTAGTPSPLAGIQSIHMFSRGSLHGAFMLVEPATGIVPTADAAHPGKGPILPSFAVDSLDAALEKVEKHGAKIHVPKTEIGGGMGYFARFFDTEGNLLGAWCGN